jgi:hypothetical protein
VSVGTAFVTRVFFAAYSVRVVSLAYTTLTVRSLRNFVVDIVAVGLGDAG